MFNNPMELMGFLKNNGMLSPKNQAICLDLITNPENKNLLNDYLETLAPEIIRHQLTGSPFKIPEENLSRIINFATTENGMPVGLDFSEQSAHTLVCGSPGTGKSTIFKQICLGIIAYNKFIEEH